MSISRSRDIFSFCYKVFQIKLQQAHHCHCEYTTRTKSTSADAKHISCKAETQQPLLGQLSFSFSSRSLQQLYDMMLSSQHSATAPWTKSVILHYFHLFPQSIHCQPVRVCFANQIEICTRFVRVVTRICQSCDMDLSKGLSKL